MSEIKKLETLLNDGEISRREFLLKLSALGTIAAASPLFMNTHAKAETPNPGGTFRIGCSGGNTTDSLDPAVATNWAATLYTFGLLRNCLVELDYKGNAVPELAESWEPSADVATWTFKIRNGVEFHNGKTLDSQDVIFSVNHHRKKDSKSGAKGLVKSIKDIKSDGKHTVIFELEDGNADFPYYMADYHIGIVPAGTEDFEKGIGTGGYLLLKHEPGVVLKAKRNPNYWKKERAHFDEVEVLVINDFNARLNALRSRKVDAINNIDAKTADLVKNIPGIKLLDVSGWLHYTLPMLVDTLPFDSNDVRLAMKLALDREKFLKIILRGYGALGNDHPIPANVKYHASELPQREYDPEKAKYLIKKAGYGDYKFQLHCNSRFPSSDEALLYREHAAKAGINIEIVKHPVDGYGANVWTKVPWCTTYWGGRPTVDQMFATTYAGDAPWNDTHFNHERFNRLLKEGRVELNEDKRKEIYFEMQQILRDEGGVVVPMFSAWLDGVKDNLKHSGNPAGNLPLDGFKAPERWWFA